MEMIKPKMLPVYMVLFAFAHFVLNFYAVSKRAVEADGAWASLADVLGFPLLGIADPARLAGFLAVNSVLWAILFACVVLFLQRR